MNLEKPKSSLNTSPKVAVIGGGVAGSVIAMQLAKDEINVTLVEQGDSLVNGPPICHLHTGGSFYRQLTDKECFTLLRQSIEMHKVFPACVNVRPTIIAVPQNDMSDPAALLERLNKLQCVYAELVENDPKNLLLGPVEQYYNAFSKQQLLALKQRPLPDSINQLEDWLIPFAHNVNLDKLKFPVILVQEYGLSGFRFGALAELELARAKSCQLLKNTRVQQISPLEQGWRVCTQSANQQVTQLDFDFIVNACGYRSGELDDMLSLKRHRMLEFKAAYVAHWPKCHGIWPEVLIHGERGTPHGMAQLTPYPDGYFQLHGMTHEITLFSDGLARSDLDSSQPQLPPRLQRKLMHGWPEDIVRQRTLSNISHISQYLPAFETAQVAAKPLFGAQQIPGDNPELRTADVSFYQSNYARAEIVKASSALDAARLIHKQLRQNHPELKQTPQSLLEQPTSLPLSTIIEYAEKLAVSRGYPAELARQV